MGKLLEEKALFEEDSWETESLYKKVTRAKQSGPLPGVSLE